MEDKGGGCGRLWGRDWPSQGWWRRLGGEGNTTSEIQKLVRVHWETQGGGTFQAEGTAFVRALGDREKACGHRIKGGTGWKRVEGSPVGDEAEGIGMIKPSKALQA